MPACADNYRGDVGDISDWFGLRRGRHRSTHITAPLCASCSSTSCSSSSIGRVRFPVRPSMRLLLARCTVGGGCCASLRRTRGGLGACSLRRCSAIISTRSGSRGSAGGNRDSSNPPLCTICSTAEQQCEHRGDACRCYAFLGAFEWCRGVCGGKRTRVSRDDQHSALSHGEH